ncbi:glycosyltransferase [Leisingera sp. ANG-DT]|uniref:glycosyltransferase n=1 Tax=Leisingera sp. ANG-DT TaxID=1577897 RepID=UPI00187C10D3|nr:glycosyltransferase [Leisingera sp. ANG-DT]
MAVASAELLMVLYLPPYRALVRARMKRPVSLMVVGAQKSGTTWVHAQLERQQLAAVAQIKECHHFDRGRMWSLQRYLAQFEGLENEGPVVEVAPDYGPMPLWRIRAVRALFPDMKVVFIARNPVERAWSGAKMETAFDRGWSLADVPVRDLAGYLCLKRSRRYSDYASQLERWSRVFGRDRLRVFPFEQISSQPQELLEALLSHATDGRSTRPVGETTAQVFPGEDAPVPEAVRNLLQRIYAPEIDAFGRFLEGMPDHADWQRVLTQWHTQAESLTLPPDSSRTLLYLCGFAPNPDATSSGQKLARQKILEKAGGYKSVRLMYFMNELDRLDQTDIEWPANVQDLGQISISKPLRLLGMLRHPWLPGFVSARRLAAKSCLEQQLADPALTDFYADFSQGLAPVDPSAMPLFRFRQHDIVSKLYSRMAAASSGGKRLFYRFETWRAQQWEKRTWGAVMEVNTLAHEDAEMIRNTVPGCAAAGEPVRGTVFVDPSKRTAETIVPGRIGFWGNMARQENVDAVTHMARSLLPAIRAACPHAHFWIIGAHPADQVKALAGEDVHVTGFIEDPTEVFCSLDIAVAPLRLGSGVKIKVFETLDTGIPTVVSPVGGEGIGDHPLLHVAQDDQQMIDAILQQLQPGQDRKAG